MGGLLSRDEHGAERGAHARGAIHLRKLHASEHKARDDLKEWGTRLVDLLGGWVHRCYDGRHWDSEGQPKAKRTSRVLLTILSSAEFISRAPMPGTSGSMPRDARRFTPAHVMGMERTGGDV